MNKVYEHIAPEGKAWKKDGQYSLKVYSYSEGAVSDWALVDIQEAEDYWTAQEAQAISDFDGVEDAPSY